MSDELEVYASELRTKFRRVFELVGELYNMIYGEKPEIEFKKIVEITDQLYENKRISDYIHASLKYLYGLYPELLPAKVAQDYKQNEAKEQAKLKDYNNLLNITIKELNDEIGDIAKELAEKRILNQN